MAIQPDQLARIHTPQKPAQPQGDQPAASAFDMTFYRNDFLNIQGSEIRTDRRGRPEATQEDEQVTFTESMHTQFRRFLHNYTKELAEMRRRDSTILEGDAHINDRLFLKELVDTNGQPNVDKIDSFLGNNPANWEIAALAMSHHANKLLDSVRMAVHIEPQGEKNVDAEARRIRTMIGEGMLHKVFVDTVWPYITDNMDTTGGRPDPNAAFAQFQRWVVGIPPAAGGILGAGIGLLFGNPAAGAAIGVAAPTAGMAAIRSFREGVVLNVQQMNATFESLDPRPAGIMGGAVSDEIRFMSAMTGINLDNYEVVAGNIQLRVDPITGVSANHEITKSPEQNLEEALKLMYTRQEFLSKLGIPYERLDADVRQFITGRAPGVGNDLMIEQTAFRGDADVFQEFLARSEGAIAALGGAPLLLDDELRIWRESSATVIGRKMQGEIDERLQREERGGVVAKLDDLIGEEKWEAFEAKRKKIITQRKGALTADQTTLEGINGKVKTYRINITTHQQKIEKTRMDTQGGLADALDALRNPGAPGVPGAPFPDALTALTALYAVQDTPGTSIIVDGRTIRSINERSETAENALNLPLTGTSPAQQGLEKTQREEAYRRTMDRVNQDATTIQAMVDRVRKSMGATKVEVDENLQATQQEVLDATGALERLQPDFDAIVNMPAAIVAAGGVPAGGISENDLRTLNIDQLLTRVNELNTYGAGLGVNVGWPETQNNLPEVRTRLINAMAESRARTISAEIGTPRVEFITLADNAATGGWEVTEHQLNTLTAQQIIQLVTARQTADPRFAGFPIPLATAVELAKVSARERLSARNRGMEEMVEYLKIQVGDATREETDFNLLESQDRYKMAREFLANNMALLEGARDMTAAPDRYFNTAAVDPTDPTTTEAEREQYTFTPIPGLFAPPIPPVTVGYSRGYTEWMDRLFHYKKGDVEGTNRAFRIARAMLPPDRLARILNDVAVEPVAPVGPRNDIDAVLFDVRTLLDSGTINWAEIQEALSRAGLEVANETRARVI